MTANDLDKRKNLPIVPIGVLIVNLYNMNIYINIFYSRVHSIIHKCAVLLNKLRILMISEAKTKCLLKLSVLPMYAAVGIS